MFTRASSVRYGKRKEKQMNNVAVDKVFVSHEQKTSGQLLTVYSRY
jgi:hypothetical protein